MTSLTKANEFILNNKKTVNPMFRNQYHLMGPIGWINDPNGFVYFRGEYHLFYQFYPYDSVWGPMHWGHAKSKDLIHWEDLPVALAPSEDYDIDGCFSGTALVKDDKLYLFYTGHVENETLKREVQCMAVSDDGIHFEKSMNNPLVDETHIENIASPEDFRDPKVFAREDVYFMLVASQTADSRGQILMFRSKNLKDWFFYSVLLEGNSTQGIMWECPDLFQLNGKDVLIMSPIQMPKEDHKYANRSSTVAFIGKINWETGKMHVDNYHEIDSGLDFYAPQTVINGQGERYLTAWMQMWDRNMPTNDLKHGWAGSMTLPRKLSIKNNKLIQQPVKFSKEQLISKRKLVDVLVNDSRAVVEPIKKANRINLEVDLSKGELFTIHYGKNEENYFEISYNVLDSLLTISRELIGQPITGAEKPNLNKRSAYVPLNKGKLGLDLYGDTSSIELFTHDGQTLSTTFFEENFTEIIEITSTGDALIEVLEIYDINVN
ncbi:glycoside hydrolase family 32 protein [Vagococcus fluvialis]|uniref:glycoside hydrolase family 32 protein n=1 Tax=Vagococcus fluvialis TaxID=2738 RepID=UPI002034863E|nr:glycoside hydrolase family 32 protein [Vagococcus fluvialis]MCM2139543.1 glycoside hydrolase family 32 protein [Vagococcus fluvialis]